MKNILGRIFSLEECKEIIKSFDKKIWDNRIGNNSNYFVMHSLSKTYNYKNEFVEEKFKNLINSNFGFKVTDVNMYILKYLPGQFFGRHYDRNPSSESHKDYIYNINVLLNDEFTGGEFYLNDTKFEGNTPGIAYTYNSDEFHEVKPVTSGIRYSMLCYVRERDFINKTTKSLL